MVTLPSISHSSMELEFSSSPRRNGNKVDASGKGSKRNNSSGIRVVGNRIYDSANGKTCHQCRQKTRDFAAACKNLKKGKPCTIRLCHKCLLNRYGERAEEVGQMSDWTCPKCRGICNCSFCMKKRGQQPTGVLIRTAKASGFKSVSDMLCINPEDLESNKVNDVAVSPSKGKKKQKRGDDSSSDKVLTSKTVPPKKQVASDKELVVLLSGEPEKENSLDLKVQTSPEKSKKTKRKKLKEISNSNSLDTDRASEILTSPEKSKKTKRKKLKEISNSNSLDTDRASENKSVKRSKRNTNDGTEVCNEVSEKETKVDGNHDTVPALMNGPEAWARNDFLLDINKMFGKNCKGTVTGNGSHAGVKSQKANKLLPAVSGKQTQVDRNHCTRNGETDGPDSLAANDILDGPVTLAPKGYFFGLNQYDMKQKNGKYLNNPVVIDDADDNAGPRSLTGVAGFPIASLISGREKIEEDIPLPPGTELKDILGIEFEPEDVGNALQLLEFCRVFGKALDLKKGEAEAILRELGRKQSLCRGHNTLVVQFQIRLLTMILIDSGNKSPSLTTTKGNNSWLKALEDLVTESELVLKNFPLDWLEEGISGYCDLDLSKKLRLLNFLCDEALCTEKLRSYIDDQNSRHAEEVKEAKSKVAAAKEKEKGLRQKLQNEVAKAVMSNVGTLSMEEHDALLKKIKSEAAQAHAVMLEAKGIIPKRKKSSDAMRIRHEFSDTNGQAFWKLKSYNDESAVLLQEIRIEDETATAAEEKWSVYGPEKKDELDKYISSRAKRVTRRKVSYMLSNESSEANM